LNLVFFVLDFHATFGVINSDNDEDDDADVTFWVQFFAS